MTSERSLGLPERIDPAAVRGRVRPGAVAELAQRYDDAGRLETSRRRNRLVVGVLGGCFAMFVLLGLIVVAALHGDPDQPTAATVFGVCALVIVAAAVGTWIGRRRQRLRWPRLEAFARANGLDYVPEIGDPPLPGMIFRFGIQRIATDVLRTSDGAVEFGNYTCNAGAQSRSLTRWGYIAIRLPTALPNIVLRARRGAMLPAEFDANQRLGLEGDFDRSFTLYCPREYERDALYLFTPDVMARFLDRAGDWDVEIVDDRLFLYRNRDAVTLDARTWEQVIGVARAVGEKTLRWARWRDEHPRSASMTTAPAVIAGRTADATVAPAGRRLVGRRVLYVAGTGATIAVAVLIPRIIDWLNR